MILSACGGSGAQKAQTGWQTVTGAGFRFQAPAGWRVTAAPKRATAAQGGELVQVSTFPLVRPYRPALFARVAVELRARMGDLARQTGGTLAGERTLTANGGRAHAFDLAGSDHVDEYTFVLQGKREYLLLCRRKSRQKADFCTRLVTSFAA